MQLTEVKVYPVTDDEKLKGYATIVFDGCFVVRDLKIINGNSGLFVAMPSKKKKDGTYRDTAHPLNNETRQMIEEAVLGGRLTGGQGPWEPLMKVRPLPSQPFSFSPCHGTTNRYNGFFLIHRMVFRAEDWV